MPITDPSTKNNIHEKQKKPLRNSNVNELHNKLTFDKIIKLIKRKEAQMILKNILYDDDNDNSS